MTIFSETYFVDLQSDYGLIAVSGANAAQFLQGQLTCDIREITPENHKIGAYCNLKGRIRALCRIFILGEIYYLQLPNCILSTTAIQLKKYAVFSKVSITDVSQQFSCLGIFGDHVSIIVSELQTEGFLSDTGRLLFLEGEPPRFLLVTPISQQAILLKIFNEHFNLNRRDFEAWKLLDIRAGIPQVWSETVEQFLPHDLNLPQLGAVSFNKGCYCGQEIVARMEYRAKLKRHLYRVTISDTAMFASSLLPGTILDSGTIVSTSTYDNTTEILGVKS